MTAKTKLALLAATAALAIASGGAAQAGSVKVAQISTISGGFPFGDVVKGTQSYFNLVNAAGGVNGTTFEFMAGDDKGQASESAQLARKFVLQDGVVAFIGNTSLSDCPANTAFYESKKILAIGGGTQTTCFTTPNWIPVNTGPYIGHLAVCVRGAETGEGLRHRAERPDQRRDLRQDVQVDPRGAAERQGQVHRHHLYQRRLAKPDPCGDSGQAGRLRSDHAVNRGAQRGGLRESRAGRRSIACGVLRKVRQQNSIRNLSKQ
jgi:hypothetical protein